MEWKQVQANAKPQSPVIFFETLAKDFYVWDDEEKAYKSMIYGVFLIEEDLDMSTWEFKVDMGEGHDETIGKFTHYLELDAKVFDTAG